MNSVYLVPSYFERQEMGGLVNGWLVKTCSTTLLKVSLHSSIANDEQSSRSLPSTRASEDAVGSSLSNTSCNPALLLHQSRSGQSPNGRGSLPFRSDISHLLKHKMVVHSPRTMSSQIANGNGTQGMPSISSSVMLSPHCRMASLAVTVASLPTIRTGIPVASSTCNQ